MNVRLTRADSRYRRMLWQRGYDFALAQREAGKTDAEIFAMQSKPLTEFDSGIVAALKTPRAQP